MAERILGHQGSRRRRRFLWVPALFVACIALFMITGAQAVYNTGTFQLDGDAASGTTAITGAPAATDDWDKVCHQVLGSDCSTTSNTGGGSTAPGTTGATAVSWVAEPDGNASIFTGGGSKDGIDIDQWAWKDGAGGLPDKDNLLHSFAARYSITKNPDCTAPATATTCEELFFGSDRLDNSGDAQQGFWFFQNKITTGGGKIGGGTGFTGVHRDGDLLVISDFSNGGTTSTITIYIWDHTVSGNLKQLETSDNAKCSNALISPIKFCGIVNPVNGTVAPWPFTDKSAKTTYLNGEFYEGGVNLSALGLGDECFASVASETRSSTSTTAVLKDFVLGPLGSCTATMSTQTSSSSVNPGSAVHDTATVVGSKATKTPAGDVTFFLCSFAIGNTTDACDDSDAVTGLGGHHGVQVGTAITLAGSGNTSTAQSADVNTATGQLAPGRYCFRSEWPGDSNYIVDSPPLKEFSKATECFDVLQHSTTTVTEPRLATGGTAITSAGVPVGTHVVDHALVTGATGFGVPTGGVDFFICDPSQVTGSGSTATCATGTGTALADNRRALTGVSGSLIASEATSSPDVIANAVGTWCFRGEYVSSDAKYTGSFDASHSECFTVTDSSSGTSAQTWRPNDSVTVSSTSGQALTGTLDITLRTGSCTGATVYTEPQITLSGTSSGTAFSTHNTTYDVTTGSPSAQVTYYWRAVFAATNTLVSGFVKCEKTDITINNSP
jgi:hypothetical protein